MVITEPTSTDGREPSSDYKRFFEVFFKARGALKILLVSTLFSFGVGSVIGLIPAKLADRYARISHGFTGDEDCSAFVIKPAPCRLGSDQAQGAAAWSNVALSILMLVSNPVVGAMSDTCGRRPIILLSLVLSCIPAAVFLLLQRLPQMHPAWYYASSSLVGAVSYLSIVFAALSDVIPDEFRAPSFGLLLAGFYGGFALAPSIPVLLQNDELTAATSFALIAASLVIAVVFLPETLSDEIRDENRLAQQAAERETSDVSTERNLVWLSHTATRPLREIAILNRDWSIRFLTAGSFFSAMVFASDATLVLYYIEEQLDVGERDIASMFFFLGVAGIIIQGGLLQPLIACLGEKRLLVVSFVCGTCHNLLYGIAKSKEAIYVALIVSQLTKTNFPLISSLASKDVESHEQGRIQGALFAVGAIANAIGPLSMEYVYNITKNVSPGFMFIYAAGLYAIGTIIVSMVPAAAPRIISETTSEPLEEGSANDNTCDGDLEEPLLTSHHSDQSS